MQLQHAIAARRSTRAFHPHQITDKDLHTIITAAQHAPVARSLYQHVHLTIIQNPALLQQINTLAQSATGNPAVTPTYGAPTLIIVSGQQADDGIEIANTGVVIQNIMLAATDLGLGSVYIWTAMQLLNDDPALLQTLQIPDNFRPISAVALGHPLTPVSDAQAPHPIPVTHLK